MKVTEGVNWVITCTPAFEQAVGFFRDVMGLSVAEEGAAVTDTQFIRYTLMKLPNGGTLEIVEPANEAIRELYTAPIVCFTVDDVAQARRELEGRGVEFVAPIFWAQEDFGWTYFRAPDGHVYQISGGVSTGV